MPQLLSLIVLAIDLFPIQLNLQTEAAAEVVVVAEVTIEVTIEVTVEVTRMGFVPHDGNTTVVALQARRTHLYFSYDIKKFTPNFCQRLGQEDPPILGWR